MTSPSKIARALLLAATVLLTPQRSLHAQATLAAPSVAGAAGVSGTVRMKDGTPAAGLLVFVHDRQGVRALTDSLGKFTLGGLEGPSALLRITSFRTRPLDTAVTLRPGRTTRVRLVLEPSPWMKMEEEQRRAQKKWEETGGVDSSARGLLAPRDPRAVPPLTFAPFGARLLAAAVHGRGADSNTVLSPVSAGLALSLAQFGARGATESALSNALGTARLDRASIQAGGEAFLAATRGRRDVQLEIATSLWVDSDARLLDSFSASAAAWRSSTRSLPLATTGAMATINGWADSATHGKIREILGTPLSRDAKVFIANAVYFKGKWLDPFEKSATKPHDFVTGSGTRISVPAMTRTASLGYRRTPLYQMVRLPYRGGRAAMYVILPDSGTGAGLQERFVDHGWPPSLVGSDMRSVHLVLPKLHVEQSHDLEPLLDSLGAGIAFSDGADFSGLAVDARGAPMPLVIERAIQKVFLDVDEEGTEAVAVTTIEVGITSYSPPPPPIEFIVDRPFLFMLRDEVTGANLFVGRIAHP